VSRAKAIFDIHLQELREFAKNNKLPFEYVIGPQVDASWYALGQIPLSDSLSSGAREEKLIEMYRVQFYEILFNSLQKGNKALIEKEARILAKKALSDANSKAAWARLEKDPKQKAKREVYDLFLHWRKKPALYKSAASFARAMVDKFPDLVSTQVIERWVRIWNRESISD
jgi:hypothetical protein